MSQKDFKFLCIPCAMTNAKTFHVQLAPFIKAVAAAEPGASFYLTQGLVEVKPAEGFETYFGPPPILGFLEFDGLENIDLMERLRDFPEELTAEDTLRKLLPDGTGPVRRSLVNALDALYLTMKEHGPFDGVLGYSEDATMAATLVEDARLMDTLILADTDSEVIDAPTLHVIGSNDPFLQGVMALYHICDSDSAVLFDHGQGHIIVRDELTLKGLAVKVHKLIKECQ